VYRDGVLFNVVNERRGNMVTEKAGKGFIFHTEYFVFKIHYSTKFDFCEINGTTVVGF
jgi:hypothetical protein